VNYTLDEEAKRETSMITESSAARLTWWAGWFRRYLAHFGIDAHVGPIHGQSLVAKVGGAVVMLTPDMGGMFWAVTELLDMSQAPALSPSSAAGEAARVLERAKCQYDESILQGGREGSEV
jgi:hypothetical protein